jgi:hypothetical protein
VDRTSTGAGAPTVIKVNVSVDIQAMKRTFEKSQQEVNRAAGAALQRVAISARKVADQNIRQRITLKSSDVKGAITVVFPFGRNSLIRDIQAVGDPIPLKHYAARKTRKGVTFAVVRGQRKVYRRRGNPAFIVDSLGGHVFVRQGRGKGSKIHKVFGPSLTQRFGTKRVLNAITDVVNNRWSIEFDRQIAFRRQAGRL